jgi:hypothetical protein
MSNWLHSLPVGWMAVVVLGGTYLATAGIYSLVMALAKGDRARAFKSVSPGLLSPLGVIFGLFVAFLAAQVWNDLDRSRAAVNHEASALRAVVLLSSAFPGEPETRLRGLIHKQIEDARDVEWPAMARRQASIVVIPTPLAEALRTVMSLSPAGDGQIAAQREILSALENALDARRQRILLSQSAVNSVKWSALIVQAAVTLLTIAMVHCDNRLSAGLALGLFSTAVAVSILLLTAHDRPFTGQLAVQPNALLQVLPNGP